MNEPVGFHVASKARRTIRAANFNLFPPRFTHSRVSKISPVRLKAPPVRMMPERTSYNEGSVAFLDRRNTRKVSQKPTFADLSFSDREIKGSQLGRHEREVLHSQRVTNDSGREAPSLAAARDTNL